MNHKIKIFIVLFLTSLSSFSQEGIPVYSDYLSDNYYLIHPSMAGASSCDKLRLTVRGQWFGEDDAPALQTLSYNARVGEKSGLGGILFNDRNGYHSQKGMKVTYAHHLMFSRDEIDLNQLSFGLSANFLQSQLDETSFLESGDFDPVVSGIIVQDATYFNVDFGLSYNYLDFYAHATVHNAAETKRKIYTDSESGNLRRFLFSAGYVFGNSETIMWEPSILFQLVNQTDEKSIDANIKAYKSLEFGRVWAALSYRRSIEGAEYLDGDSVSSQKLQYITPILGINYKQFMFAYTYSYLSSEQNFDTGGFHQITLGFDFNCKRERYHCNCPAVN